MPFLSHHDSTHLVSIFIRLHSTGRLGRFLPCDLRVSCRGVSGRAVVLVFGTACPTPRGGYAALVRVPSASTRTAVPMLQVVLAAVLLLSCTCGLFSRASSILSARLGVV